MKKWFILLSAAALLSSCQGKDKKADGAAGGGEALTEEQKQKALSDPSNFTTLEWIDPTTRNLGKLVKDQTIEITYRFKNSGTKNLIIENVTAQCGCTIPEKPEKPIPPGEEGIIRAKFNGSGQGTISKQIYVKANTTPATDHTLTFTGDIQETEKK
ncbi:MAG: DUF1573 domain-containing protein [Chitinophagaceae bacterium]